MADAERVAALRQLVRRAQSERRVPGVAAAVAVRGEIVLADAVGLASVEPEHAATADTQFRVGSITKTFTAAAILSLRDEGRLTLDDPLSHHLGSDVAHGGLTLRRLLSHLSGLQREPPGDIWETMRPPSRDELLAGLADAEAVLGPGEAWHYSNLAYSLLGEVVERASGRPYREVLDERLLRPLGLEHTSFAPRDPAARGYLVEPYFDGVRLEAEIEEGFDAAGGLWSTVTDLVRWGSALAVPEPSFLKRAAAEEMHRPQAILDPDAWTRGWGLGIELRRRGDRVLAGHGGAMPGHLAGLGWSRQEQVAAAVLANTSAGFEPMLLVGDLLEHAIAAWPRPAEAWRPGPPPPAELAGLLGRWWSEGEELVFAWHDGRLEARTAGGSPDAEPAVFEADGPDRLRTRSGRERGEALRIVRDADGGIAKLYWATYPLTRGVQVFGPAEG